MAERVEGNRKQQEDDEEDDQQLFGLYRRLRRCRRCGHFPCPHCVNWCDVLYVDKAEAVPLEPPHGSGILPHVWRDLLEALRKRPVNEQEDPDETEQPECPCFADDQQCLMTYGDWECNNEVFQIFTDMHKEFERQGATVTGSGMTEDGRLILYGRWT